VAVTAMLSIISITLILVIVVQTILHGRERKDLYNRIMARDLTEYEETIEKSETTGRAHNVLVAGRKRILEHAELLKGGG